jgi:hypothetical protein
MDEQGEKDRKPYRPTKGSAGYSILVSLAFEFEKGNADGFSKDDLCRIGNVWATKPIESNRHGTERIDQRALVDRKRFAKLYCGWDVVDGTLIEKHKLLLRFKKGISTFPSFITFR